MIPKIIYSDRILKIINPFMSIRGITIFPFIILKSKYDKFEYLSDERDITINHECIHIAQQKELLIIPFFILYFVEWFIKLFKYGANAYYNISFEREAFSNQNNLEYFNSRKMFSSFKYILKK